ncbi:hypothetical protein FYD77_14270 [Salmonella enterica]|nr:hypothetical protein [Salmonella enterica]EIC3910037.1 hypothetical protein [Salmonella enterica]
MIFFKLYLFALGLVAVNNFSCRNANKVLQTEKRNNFMSWENVAGLSKIQIWAESCSSSDGDEAFLFVNDNHQILITVGVSLALYETSKAGPTLEEVKSAISLIDNSDGDALKFLVEGDAGDYISVYDPSHVNAQKINNSNFQYQFKYYLSSNKTINPNVSSEEVSAKISYKNSDDSFIYDMSSQGDYSIKDYVKVTMFAEKEYGLKGSGKTTVTLEKDSVSPHHVFSDYKGYKLDDATLYLYHLTIADSYFHIVDLNYGPQQGVYGSIQNLAYGYDQSQAPMWMYTASVFCPAFIHGLGEKTISDVYKYDIGNVDTICVRYDYNQRPHEIALLAAQVDINRHDAITGHSPLTGGLTLHDQFGNKIIIDLHYKYVDDHKLIPVLNGVS